MEQNILNVINKQRNEKGLLTIKEIIEISRYNKVYDVFSLLISKNVKIGKNNIFYNNIIIEAVDNSSIEIGDNNILGNGTSIYTNAEKHMFIGNNCRFDGKVNIYGNNQIGDGCQILGYIQVYDCILEKGNDFNETDPNQRGAVLKGVGRAKNLKVQKGYVINGVGDFKQENEELQINYHK